MVFGLFRNRKHNQAIMTRQYDALTRISRQPVFFLDYGMPDTVMGRFEMVAIVMILFFRRTASMPSFRIWIIRFANSASAMSACRSG